MQLSHTNLRGLAAAMRAVRMAHQKALGIQRVHLLGREKIRGYFRGILELHCQPEDLRATGLHRQRGTTITLQR